MSSNFRRTTLRSSQHESPSYPYPTPSRSTQDRDTDTVLANGNRHGSSSGTRFVDTTFNDTRQNSLDSNQTLLNSSDSCRSSQTNIYKYGIYDNEDCKDDTLLHPRLQKSQCTQSDNWLTIDSDDPRLTVPLDELLRDEDMDITTKEFDERRRLLKLSEKQKRKERRRLRIVKHVTSEINRQRFIMKLAKALMKFGAPTHAIDSLLSDSAKILGVEAKFVMLPGVNLASFGDVCELTSQIELLKSNGSLDLGRLPKVRIVYYNVTHDCISAKIGSQCLDQLMDEDEIHGRPMKCLLALCGSALICPLAFGGSFLDMWIAGLGAAALCAVELYLITKNNVFYTNVYQIATTVIISLIARALGSIRTELFCYNAISSASIVGILPGFLIVTSSLELASRNMLCGSVKMVYALIFSLFICLGLQIGSDLYLLFDAHARSRSAKIASSYGNPVLYTGTFVSDNIINGIPEYVGTFLFKNPPAISVDNVVSGCHRPPNAPWYMLPFPSWTQIIIVPLFCLIISMSNMQPVFKKLGMVDAEEQRARSRKHTSFALSSEMMVQVVFACAAYTANKVATRYIFNHSDIVSAIGAFTVGILGNGYQRLTGGTAFTAMVPGVLFLVPSGLSETGDIFSGDPIDLGISVIQVSIGIVVGLLMARAVVYAFGTKARSGSLSF